MESLERLQGLHADLIALSQRSLSNIDRLWHELAASIQDFRQLLDKSTVPNEVTTAYNAGKIEVDGQEYGINEEFRHLSNAVATALNVEEENAAKLIIETQRSGIHDNEPAIVADVVQKYHDRRDFLLQDIRLVLHHSLPHASRDERDGDFPQLMEHFQELAKDILDVKDGIHGNAAAFANKCLRAMDDIESWQVKLNEQIQSKAILSQARGQAFYLTLEFQRSSLFKQHEALGAILALLFHDNRAGLEVLHKLIDKSKKWHRLDFNCVHYLPAFSAGFHQHTATSSAAEAQALNSKIILKESQPDRPQSPYRPLSALLEMWWTATYSGLFRESAAKDPNADKRDEVMRKGLDEGALELMLSLCVHMQSDPWQKGTRQELVDMLLDGSNFNFDGIEPTSSYFYTIMMESFEAFAESWISNMPDSIRKLKSDEDDQRLIQVTSDDGQLQAPPRDSGVRLHLEAFLTSIAFSFDGRPEAAVQFWDDPDGNLHGFLQWASRRQTVPRVAAFCDMLCAISQGSENAGDAHKFLLEDTVPVPNSRRKLPTLSYQQIFTELDFYSKRVHQKSQAQTLSKNRQNTEPEMNESESPIMLSCYLRLLRHLFIQNTSAGSYVLSLPDVDLPKSLLTLSSGPIPSYLRASIFSMFEALLTDKSPALSDRMWTNLEEWASYPHDRASVPTSSQQQPTPMLIAVQRTLTAISTSYDQFDSFVKLLTVLVDPLPEASGQPLPFPVDLGANYRSLGITPYVDFVCAQLTPSNVRNWIEDGNSNGLIRCIDCINFMIAVISSFNENIVTKLDKTSPEAGGNSEFSRIYSQRHPFARVMQWAFSFDLNKCLMDLLHQPIEPITSAPPEHPKVVNVQRVTELLNLIIELQPTYFDVVKPRLRTIDDNKTIQYSGVTAIEDSIIGRPEILLDLCQYATTGHVPLALQSLQFLQKLSASSKFQNHLFEDNKFERKARQMIEMIGPLGESKIKQISATLAEHFNIDFRELEAGAIADGYNLKKGVLGFLNACLANQPDMPNLAHLLLGFVKVSSRLAFSTEIEQGSSMLDALILLAGEYPDGVDNEMLSWLLQLKDETISVHQHLWSSPISSELAMIQMRRARFLITLLSTQSVISQSTIWDGHSIVEPLFWFRTSAEAFASLLRIRSMIYDYVSREVRSVAKANIKAQQEQYLVALQGRHFVEDGVAVNHPSIFDLFDFAELDTSAPAELGPYESHFFKGIDFDMYRKDGLYDIEAVRLVLQNFSRQTMQNEAQAGRNVDEDDMNEEAMYIIGLLEARNRCLVVQEDKLRALGSYVDMVISIVDCCPMNAATQTSFSLRMLQLILPKLDTCFSDGMADAIELTRAADILLLSLTGSLASSSQSRVEVTIAEKLFQLFRTCAEGIPLSANRPELKAVLYSICSRYLASILSSNAAKVETSLRACRNAMDTVRSIGERLINILADDADDGLDSCRLNALSLLGHLVSLARQQKSNIIVEQFVKSNIIEVLLDPIKDVAGEFQSNDPSTRPFILQIHMTRTLLLLQLSRTKPGASALIDANLIQTLRDSMLFAIDPDIGLDLSETLTSQTANKSLDMKSAIQTYFVLLGSCLRIFLSAFTSYGPENEKMIYIVRQFLAEYRGNMVGVFKRAAGLSISAQNATLNSLSFASVGTKAGAVTGTKEMQAAVEECLKCYTGLAIGSGFLDFEDESGLDGNGIATINTGFARSGLGGNGFT